MLRMTIVFCLVTYGVTSLRPFTTLYDPGKPISSATIEISLTGRFKRETTSHHMIDTYDVTWMVGGRETRARLTRADSVGDLLVYDDAGQIKSGRASGYQKDWGTYTSDDVDGVFIVHRHPHNYSTILVEGYFMEHGRPVLIQPRDFSGTHVLHTLNKPSVNKRHESLQLDKIGIQKRGLNDPMTIELRVYTDATMLSVLDTQLDGTINRDDFIAKHYAMLISFMNKRLETLPGFAIRVSGVGLHILRKPLAGVLAMHHGRSDDGVRSTACDAGSLDRFEEYIQTTPHNYDHAMLYTGYDLLNQEGKPYTAGIANTGLMCTRKAASVVEFRGTVNTLHVATHELGHSLGAAHDGETSKLCNDEDNYIMRAFDSDPFDTKKAENFWIFSTCSAKDIELNFRVNPDRKACLIGPPKQTPDTFESRETHYGGVLTRNVQCKIFTGDKHSFSRPLSRDEEQTVCTTGLICAVPSELSFRRYLPYDGMRCSSLMWCEGGKCVKGWL